MIEDCYNIINGKWICKKCNHEIKTSRIKHFQRCDGFGPRSLKYKNKTVRYSDEYNHNMSELKKAYYADPSNRICLSNSIKKAYADGKLTGRAKTKEKEIVRKEKISKAMVGNPNGATSFRRRKIEYQGKIYKSSWEVLVAKYFVINNIQYEYEEKTFLLGERRSYTPDFFITDKNLFVEVKGYWRKENKEKFDLFLAIYPNITIEVWGKEKLKELNIFSII